MTEEELKIKASAEEYAKKNKKIIAKEKTSLDLFPTEKNPVSVFMAGSPGAGKTESSRELIKKFTKDSESIIRIDPDELRECFNSYGYCGSNSSLFQGAVTIIAEKMHDMAIDNEQSFVFDSTFSKIDKARINIQRSINHDRFVQIYYIYQNPLQAWEFVKAREAKEGRNIPKDNFIDQYFSAHETVNQLKKEFGNKIQVDLLVKNIDGTNRTYRENIDNIDFYVKEEYTRNTLINLL
jgi:UDP-N-acetylglucosamine kinase